MVSKMTSLYNDGSFLPTDAERELEVVIDNFYYPPLHFSRYETDPNGVYDSQPGIQTAFNVAAHSERLDSSIAIYPWITSLTGNKVIGQQGAFRVDSTLTLPNRVSLFGQGALSSIIFAGSNFVGSKLIDCVDGTNPIFDSQIWGFKLHGSNLAGIDNVVHSQAWQERCGLYHCDVSGYQGDYGWRISDVSGGAAGVSAFNTGFSGFSNTTAAIYVDSTVPNAFQLNLDAISINTSGVATNGLLLAKGRSTITNFHVESATHGMYLEDGTHFIQNATGSGSVVNLVTLDADFPGRARAYNLDPNGATGNTWNDLTATNVDYTGFKSFVAFGAD